MPKFAAGVVRFEQEIYPENKSLFENLSEGQAPECLFITCSDSRIETNMITQTGPGELFICRNAGNIVPPHTTHTGGMTASIEFATAALKVPHIVICGHSGCGAMQGALHPESLEGLPHVKEWIGYTRAAVAVVNELAADKSEAEKLELLIEHNVILQLQHLKTHPTVAARMAKGDVTLHGWVYDIKTGAVRAYDEGIAAFVPVARKYAAELAALGTAEACT